MQTPFQRLKVYTEVPLTERLKGLIVQFMAKVLSILAILTTQRPPSEFDHGCVSYLTDCFDSAPFDQLKRSFSPKNQPSKGSNFSLDQSLFDTLDKLMDEADLCTDEIRSLLT
jgi:hypothetical protein